MNFLEWGGRPGEHQMGRSLPSELGSAKGDIGCEFKREWGREEGETGGQTGTFILQITANQLHAPPTHHTALTSVTQSPLNTSSKADFVFFPSEVGTSLPAFATSLIS